MDRRSFAKSLWGSIAALATRTNCQARESYLDTSELSPSYESKEASPPPDYDIAIVGGGVSGIYTAWRLMTADPRAVTIPTRPRGDSTKLKIAVFEGSNRIGGRLLTACSPALAETKCELGGMRFMSSQKRIERLVKALRLKSSEMNTTGDIFFARQISLLVRSQQPRPPSLRAWRCRKGLRTPEWRWITH